MAAFRVHRSTLPEKPYRELGTVTVSCPTQTSARFGGSFEVEGGCPYDQALALASEEATQAGAHGLFNVQTSAAANGMIVSMVATAFRFESWQSQTPGEPFKSQPDKSSSSPTAPSIEERLRQLKDLRDKSLITPDDYEKRKAEILKQI